MRLLFSLNISIINANVSNNEHNGISIGYSDYINISGNEIRSNGYSGLAIGNSENSTVSYNNVISNNHYGINMGSTSYNSIFNNNIINNRWQGYDRRKDNHWNGSYPNGGNFWSDYAGIDKFNGPKQDIPGSDGIGDTNYSIPTKNLDFYPLMDPIGDQKYLYEGWNLISLPYMQTDSDIANILSPIQGKYNALQWYNSTDNLDHWKHNHTFKASNLNDLNALDHLIGFWIHIIEPGGILFELPGMQPSINQTIQLHKGWNMVGFPSPSTYNRTKGLNNLTFDTQIDAIQWFNAASKTWHFMDPEDSFFPGRGYWMHATADCVWEVPL
jgi:parallel beta-helix repeat protein